MLSELARIWARPVAIQIDKLPFSTANTCLMSVLSGRLQGYQSLDNWLEVNIPNDVVIQAQFVLSLLSRRSQHPLSNITGTSGYVLSR